MKDIYRSFDEIDQDLRLLNLRRQIALEEMKALKQELKEDLSPYQWVSTLFSAIKKYGIIYLIKKLFK